MFVEQCDGIVVWVHVFCDVGVLGACQFVGILCRVCILFMGGVGCRVFVFGLSVYSIENVGETKLTPFNCAENFPLASGGSLNAAQFLELFLFTPDKQYTYLSALSGGEKKRLQLLTILFKNPNFLILDEPTNDLDLPTLAVLEQFLIDFAGCVLLVSCLRLE